MPRSIPNPSTLLMVAAKYLEEELLPTLSGYHRFQTRVATNVLNIVRRELELREGYIRNAMYSEIASMEANVGKPAIGVLPPYLEIGAEIDSAKICGGLADRRDVSR